MFYLKHMTRFKESDLDSTNVGTMIADMLVHRDYVFAITSSEGNIYQMIMPSRISVPGIRVEALRLGNELLLEEGKRKKDHVMVVRLRNQSVVLLMGKLYPLLAWLFEQELIGPLIENQLTNLLWEYTSTDFEKEGESA